MVKRTLFLLMLVIISCRFINAKAADPAVLQIFNEAKSLFIKANSLAEQYPEKALDYYHKSAYYFESIYLNYHIKNGKLFYNIGNAYYKSGQIGKSILYYKKALLYMPSDKNLLHNLNFVRTKCIDQIDEKEGNKILKIIFFFHYRLSSMAKMILFVIFFILLWGFASLTLVLKRNLYRYLTIGALIFSMIFLSSFMIDVFYNMFNKTGVIISESVVARKGDSVTYQASFNEPLHEGTEFKLLEKRREWFNVQLLNGKKCWIKAEHAGLVND